MDALCTISARSSGTIPLNSQGVAMRAFRLNQHRGRFCGSSRAAKLPDRHKTGTGRRMSILQNAVSVVESGSAPVAQLDRASDFESHTTILQYLAKSHKNFNADYLADFRETLHK
jgi:hypothetical protein